MRLRIGVLAVAAGVSLAGMQDARAPQPWPAHAAERTAGWRLLFDGRTFAGWHVFGDGPPRRWDIADEALVALGQGGGHDIVTDDEFENFELVIDWKLSPRANSGIFFNVVEQSYDAIYATGPEYQLIDDDGWPSRL